MERPISDRWTIGPPGLSAPAKIRIRELLLHSPGVYAELFSYVFFSIINPTYMFFFGTRREARNIRELCSWRISSFPNRNQLLFFFWQEICFTHAIHHKVSALMDRKTAQLRFPNKLMAHSSIRSFSFLRVNEWSVRERSWFTSFVIEIVSAPNRQWRKDGMVKFCDFLFWNSNFSNF